MPFTPLHFGPGLLAREIIGKERFGIAAFAVAQVAFDTEPLVRIIFDIPGDLHQTTHAPMFGVVFILLSVLLTWRWERWSAVTGAVFGVISHLWLDAIYHADVLRNMAQFVDPETVREAGTDAEVVCGIAFVLYGLLVGVRAVLRNRIEHRRRVAASNSVDGVL